VVAEALRIAPRSPLARLAAGSFVTNVGNGAWYATWAVYLSREVGLATRTIGLGMTLAGAASVLASAPAGRLADRLGPRGVFACSQALQAVAVAAYLVVGGAASFLCVAALAGLAGASGGARNALVVGLAGERDRLGALARLRTVGHGGWVVGAGLGAAVLALGTRGAFSALIAVDALTYAAYAVVAARLPEVPPCGASPESRLGVLRDRPYVLLAALAGCLSLCWGMLSTALPLWLLRRTQLSTAFGAGVVLLGSALIATLQVRVGRGATTPRAAARRGVAAGLALAVSCLLFAATGGRGGPVAVALLLAGGLVHVAGELLFVAASWGLSVPLMPESAAGEYQGVFAAGEAAAQTVSPLLMTAVVVGWGVPGWLALAGLFAAVATVLPPATSWAVATRGGLSAPGGPRATPLP
jgi:predicted MFS family arabinose efflux permease